MSKETFVVTIDGPAASGKSSVSRELAARLGWQWVSTGAFYRGLAYIVIDQKISVSNEAAIEKVIASVEWNVQMAAEATLFIYRGADITEAIGAEDVGAVASQISHFPRIRQGLLDAQRACAISVGGLIAEGRDCGTVVFPGAQVKIYLTARSESRAERRAKEKGTSMREVQSSQAVRDSRDSNRKAAPLQAATEATIIDTSEITLNEVVDQVEALVRNQLKTVIK